MDLLRSVKRLAPTAIMGGFDAASVPGSGAASMMQGIGNALENQRLRGLDRVKLELQQRNQDLRQKQFDETQKYREKSLESIDSYRDRQADTAARRADTGAAGVDARVQADYWRAYNKALELGVMPPTPEQFALGNTTQSAPQPEPSPQPQGNWLQSMPNFLAQGPPPQQPAGSGPVGVAPTPLPEANLPPAIAALIRQRNASADVSDARSEQIGIENETLGQRNDLDMQIKALEVRKRQATLPYEALLAQAKIDAMKAGTDASEALTRLRGEQVKRVAESTGLSPAQTSSLFKLDSSIKSDPFYKDYAEALGGYQSVRAALSGQSGMDDIAIINGTQRMIDPGATVREGDVTLIIDRIPALKQISDVVDTPDGPRWFLQQKWMEGRVLPDSTRQSIAELAERLMQGKKANFEAGLDRYLQMSDAIGVPRNLVRGLVDVEVSPPAAAAPEPAADLPPGVTMEHVRDKAARSGKSVEQVLADIRAAKR